MLPLSPFVSDGPSSLDLDLAAVDECLTDGEIDLIFTELGHSWRQRVFTPGLTVRYVVYRGLHPDKSIAAVPTDLAARRGGLKRRTICGKHGQSCHCSGVRHVATSHGG